TKVTKNNQITEEYTYDNQGNKLEAMIDGVSIKYSYNFDDELINSINQNTNEQTLYSYNSIGQLIQKQNTKGVTQYSYDIFGNLKEVNLPNGDS
ncbi:MAG: RHS repeat protein, partial [Campylobacteraceae bacterium]|nr:RHS repeat protein [Campylobacteraceae bacterium]